MLFIWFHIQTMLPWYWWWQCYTKGCFSSGTTGMMYGVLYIVISKRQIKPLVCWYPQIKYCANTVEPHLLAVQFLWLCPVADFFCGAWQFFSTSKHSEENKASEAEICRRKDTQHIKVCHLQISEYRTAIYFTLRLIGCNQKSWDS